MEFFNELVKQGIELTVLYERKQASDRNDKWKSNGDINTIKKNQADKKEQIVMLFYKSKDN